MTLLRLVRDGKVAYGVCTQKSLRRSPPDRKSESAGGWHTFEDLEPNWAHFALK